VAYDWVSLTTDYGLADGFVAACHGMIARIAPAVRVIDVTHDVPPGDVARGAAVLAQTAPYLPPAVHVAVVDPGVGTARRAVAIETAGGVLIGPDNGLLPPAADALGGARRAVVLANPAWFAPTVSATFHGRDVFAPAAARVALGVDLADAGPAVAIADLVRAPEPIFEAGDGWLEAEVRTVDRFGNVQLAAPGRALDALAPLGSAGSRLRAGGVRAVRATTFGEAPPGGLVVYVDSTGYVAIAVNGGSAVTVLSAAPGDVLRLDVA
jgi:S-adenosylmethionine hydrolase